MKVDIWIYTDDGAEDHREGLTPSQAINFIGDAIIAQRIHEILTDSSTIDFIKDVANDRD